MMAYTPPPVRFKSQSVKAAVNQLAGQEPRYPVYFFSGGNIKTERPERQGQTYRWASDIPAP